jgi:hypothetical protein
MMCVSASRRFMAVTWSAPPAFVIKTRNYETGHETEFWAKGCEEFL